MLCLPHFIETPRPCFQVAAASNLRRRFCLEPHQIAGLHHRFYSRAPTRLGSQAAMPCSHRRVAGLPHRPLPGFCSIDESPAAFKLLSSRLLYDGSMPSHARPRLEPPWSGLRRSRPVASHFFCKPLHAQVLRFSAAFEHLGSAKDADASGAAREWQRHGSQQPLIFQGISREKYYHRLPF